MHESEINAVSTMLGLKNKMEKMISQSGTKLGRSSYGSRLVGKKRTEASKECLRLSESSWSNESIAVKLGVSNDTVARLIKEAR